MTATITLQRDGYTRHDSDTMAVPGGNPVPMLKIAAGAERSILTPRSMEAAERAVAEEEARALTTEREAAMAVLYAQSTAAEARASPRSVELAAEAAEAAHTAAQLTEKAAVAESAAAASAGTFVLVSTFFGRCVSQRYGSEGDARLNAAALWASWVLYHEQRGAKTEIGSGGWGFRQGAIRRHVHGEMEKAMKRMQGGFGGYGSNY